MVAYSLLLTLLAVAPGPAPSAETYEVLAIYYQEAGFPDSALQILKTGYPQTHAASLLRRTVEIQYALQDFPECVRSARQYLRTHGPDTLVYDLAVRALLGMDRDREARRLLQAYLQAYPDLPSAVRLAANVMEVLHRPDTALFLYRRAYLLNPQSRPLLRDYLAFLVQQDRREEAHRLVDLYGDSLQGSYKVELSWAVLLEKEGDLNGALIHYARASFLRHSPELLARMAQLSLQMDRPQEAWKILAPALETHPLNPDLLKLAGITQYHLGEYTRALHLLFAARALDPKDAETQYFLARTLRALGQEAEALKAARQAFEASQDPDYGLYLAYLLILNGQPAEALQVLRQLRLPDHAHFYTLKGFAFQLLGEPDSAYRALRQAVALDPENPKRLRDLARFCSQTGRTDETLHLLLRLWHKGQANHQDLMSLALLLADRREYARADSVFRTLYARDSTNALLLNNWGYTLAEWGQHLEFAQKLLERALQLDPDNPIYLDSMGWIYYRLGHLHLAYYYVKRAVNLGARDPEILEHLVDILQALGRLQEARRYWQEALRLAPHNERLRQKVEQTL